MIRRLALLALLALLPSAVARAEPVPADVTAALAACRQMPGAPIRSAGVTLCFSGEIDAASTARAITLLPAVTAMVITSDGGEVRAALALARALRAGGQLLVVERACVSSCANFLFTAARRKAVAPEALVVFHGGIAPQAFGGLFGGGDERQLLGETQGFFRDIGVDGSITYDPPYRRDPRSGVRSLADEWTASPAGLRRRGVGGIVSLWWPSPEAVIRQGARQGLQLGILD
ncbi:hypothetical protein E8L99_10180 [Phreatobacter aquaticus]|uniref:Uncharacterized protein n=1 Tax=Phreatobacter aquaticus TaxID=2570229 RepID=A0A4D7QJI3_9HYPH|nr:hypothetical protein [Phreatobacter aquaticus]QCK86093.1 hypothetical protein E8L99_10180 [Phreatobacter aquaticus]